ncbi:MAG: ATPase [Omnitrophica WOR_2 bacterium GWF2_38_59]|nr:MAG: ATPase [Omnitrophica WOR_2 bacterium GWF2_38_59]OGX47813.1 MAG: ATPase [Omnitrophica WOR_2 bacterium RIFOXYA2_FULL_38_17]OGX52905.1 MAG: ATPase [Omnitrophica WOR_2 bacterium RIFOXYA12_FULL_38_10]OGX56064.1 MAG: ATPase [Omnitrophica WOR_2 bacterium RIFOXYB2_FULL_38_16]OGX56968.1 MAG: ATPase [Omnitrophica WOR_2 bacterium RIFOXYC2_FULL_38_12]HBG60300.1 ATPase [Candidatus Omnitrophota bacterium]
MQNNDITLLNEKVKKASGFVDAIVMETQKVIVGQKNLIERLIIGLLANGHVLLEGVPGLAKTLAVKTLSATINTKFQRLQFTPDMLPADLMGTLIFDQRTSEFKVRKGPIFANLILADEINRSPAKVQSALLEAMQERQVTIGGSTLKLDEPFLVLATQNPIEQEGTYPLPEAQVDRFMLKLKIDYPSKDEELKILKRMANTSTNIDVNQVINPQDIIEARKVVDEIYIDEKIEEYIVDIVDATRNPQAYKLDILKGLIQYGASPRATISLAIVAKAYAFLQGRGYVTPQDVKSVAFDVLRHRVIISYEAEAEEKTSEDIIKVILDEIEVP